MLSNLQTECIIVIFLLSPNLLPVLGLDVQVLKRQQLILPLHSSHMLSRNTEHVFSVTLQVA